MAAMLTQEQAVEVRVLARQGKGVREIARELGLSRNTVRRYLRGEVFPAHRVRAPRPTKLDPNERCRRYRQRKKMKALQAVLAGAGK